MPKTDQDRVVALAGVMQATDLVRSIARRGQIQADDFETCMASLIQIDAPSSVDIYGGINRLLTGLRLLEQQLHNPQDMELTRYVVTLLRLEYKLSRREEMLDTLSAGIKDIIQNLAHFPLTHSNTIARFADLYLQTISTLSPRIMVSGERRSWLTVATKSDFSASSSLKWVISRSRHTRPTVCPSAITDEAVAM